MTAGLGPARERGEMEWSEVLIVFVVCHLVGDFLLQTEFQARNKLGGLGRDPVKRRALLCHVATYGIAFLPAAAWIALEADLAAAGLAILLVVGTHLVQDDGRFLVRYARTVKHTDVVPGTPLWMGVDQSAHVLVLFAAALLVAA